MRRQLAVGHPLQGEKPCGLAAIARSAVLDQPLRKGRRPSLQASVARVDRDATERDDPRGIEDAERVTSGIQTELAVERCPGVREPAELLQRPSTPDLEDAHAPAVVLAMREGEAFRGEPKRLVGLIEHGSRLAPPFLDEPLAPPVASLRGQTTRGLRQLECVVVAPFEVGADRVAHRQCERRRSIAAGADGGRRLLPRRLGFVPATADEEVVVERCEVLRPRVRRER